MTRIPEDSDEGGIIMFLLPMMNTAMYWKNRIKT